MIQLTYTGLRVDPWDLKPGDFCDEDVARSLSMQCRFAGHVRFHYSVAQHCLMVAYILRQHGHGRMTQLAGLVHDAGESIFVDMPTPVKRGVPTYDAAEKKAMYMAAQALGLPEHFTGWEFVKLADMIALVTEARDVLPCDIPDDWYPELSELGIEPMDMIIDAWSQEFAESQFLRALRDLRG